MTNQMESANPVSSPATPTVGQGALSGQPTSPAPVTFTPEQVDYLKPFIEQQAQSLKDRRFAALEAAVADLRNGHSAPPTPAPQTPNPSPASGGGQVAQPAEIDFLAPIQAVGLDANDRDVLQLMMKHGSNPTEFQAQLVSLKVNRAKQPPASPAAAMPGYNPVATSGKQTLINQKTAELQTALTAKVRDFGQISSLQKEIASLSASS